MQFERQQFEKLVKTDESRALRHLFFAERQVTKIPDVPEDTPVRDIKSAALIGAGTMGGGIAMNFANAGIPVKVLEMNQEALDKGLAIVRKNYAATVSKGRLSQEAMDKRMGLFKGVTSYDDIKDADIVIEAVFEDMAVKKQVFEKLDKVRQAGRHPRHQYFDAGRERDRRGDITAAGRAGAAFLQPGQCDETARSGARREDFEGNADNGDETFARPSRRSAWLPAFATASSATACCTATFAKPASCSRKARSRSRWTR